jgi:hypothetical protein
MDYHFLGRMKPWSIKEVTHSHSQTKGSEASTGYTLSGRYQFK